MGLLTKAPCRLDQTVMILTWSITFPLETPYFMFH